MYVCMYVCMLLSQCGLRFTFLFLVVHWFLLLVAAAIAVPLVQWIKEGHV